MANVLSWSKQVAVASVARFGHYNFVRRHTTVRCTPAMAAGVTRTMWSMDELIDAALSYEEAQS